MVKYNYKFEGDFTVNGVDSVYDLWSLDLSSIGQSQLIVEVTTTLYDNRAGDASIRYSTTALYKNSSATVSVLTNQTQSQYAYNQGDSEPMQITWVQGTSTLAQRAEILGVLDSRLITYLTKVTIVAF